MERRKAGFDSIRSDRIRSGATRAQIPQHRRNDLSFRVAFPARVGVHVYAIKLTNWLVNSDCLVQQQQQGEHNSLQAVCNTDRQRQAYFFFRPSFVFVLVVLVAQPSRSIDLFTPQTVHADRFFW